MRHAGFAVFRTARIDNLRYRNTRGNTTPRDDSDELARKGGVTEGHAWVNYDEGPSKGEGSGGKFYQAEGGVSGVTMRFTTRMKPSRMRSGPKRSPR